MQGWIFGNPLINLALHPNGSLTLPNCYNVHLTVLTLRGWLGENVGWWTMHRKELFLDQYIVSNPVL